MSDPTPAQKAQADKDAAEKAKADQEKAANIILDAQLGAEAILAQAQVDASAITAAAAPKNKKGRRDYGGTVTYVPSAGRHYSAEGKVLAGKKMAKPAAEEE